VSSNSRSAQARCSSQTRSLPLLSFSTNQVAFPLQGIVTVARQNRMVPRRCLVVVSRKVVS
jgi:hypothetical protein